MLKNRLFVVIVLLSLSVFLIACQQERQSLPLPAIAKINELNKWDTGELDAAECFKDYPGYIASGETHGWIFSHKKDLESLGINVRWNCQIKAYEPVFENQSVLPLCGCQK